jgi:hypothetical protein
MNNISPSKYTFSNKYFKTSPIKEVACFSTKQKDWEMDCPRSWVMAQGRTWTEIIGVAKKFRYYWKKKFHPDNFS